MNHSDEYRELRAQIEKLKAENERLNDFAQDCLTKIGDAESILRELYNKLDDIEDIRKRLGEMI
jgi:uncharacterized coiled-coil DUF342 family protein